MTTLGPRTHNYEVNAMLRVSKTSENLIRTFFSETYGVRPNRLQSDLHLTVYHGRRPLPGLSEDFRHVRVILNTDETRFMVLAPGGENPRHGLDSHSHSVGIRITKCNPAMSEIQQFRESIYRLETRNVVGARSYTTAWTSCFGSRHYQPHIQLLRPWHKIDTELTEIGTRFRSELDYIEFDLFQIEFRHRVDGHWVVANRTTRGLTPRRELSTQERLKHKVNP